MKIKDKITAALADMISDATKMVREEPALNGIYWELARFYADQKKAKE